MKHLPVYFICRILLGTRPGTGMQAAVSKKIEEGKVSQFEMDGNLYNRKNKLLNRIHDHWQPV